MLYANQNDSIRPASARLFQTNNLSIGAGIKNGTNNLFSSIHGLFKSKNPSSNSSIKPNDGSTFSLKDSVEGLDEDDE